jgi:hypothetical protein
MTTNMFRICSTILAFGLAASQSVVRAQGSPQGVWNLTVTVTNCQTGAPIRTVHSLQLYHEDGTIQETANTAARGISVGVWSPDGARTYKATYWFYRYNPDGTFHSLAKGQNNVLLGSDGTFTASGVIQDFDATGALISTGCVVQQANRLAKAD